VIDVSNNREVAQSRLRDHSAENRATAVLGLSRASDARVLPFGVAPRRRIAPKQRNNN
jgi:hypothetical protein